MGIIFSEGSGLNDSIFGKSQAPIRMFLEKRGEQFEQESLIKHMFLMGKSNNAADMLSGLTAMDGFKPVGENGEYPTDNQQEGYKKLLEGQKVTFETEADPRGAKGVRATNVVAQAD